MTTAAPTPRASTELSGRWHAWGLFYPVCGRLVTATLRFRNTSNAPGMGKVAGRRADPQFVLQSGHARNANLSLIRYEAGAKPKGTDFTYDVNAAAATSTKASPSGEARRSRSRRRCAAQ